MFPKLTILFVLSLSLSIFSQINLDSGLVAFLPLNGDAIDISGNGHDGTINGNPSLVPDRFNNPDRAYTFPDQSSSISLANSTNLNLENGFTINAWIKYTVNNYTTVIVCKHVCGFVNGYFFGIDADGQIQLWIGNSGWSTVRTNQSFVEDQWYMVTATYNSGTSIAKVYVDGVLGGSGGVTYNNYSSNPVSIGESYQNNCGAGFMDGAIDEVKIYNRALSDEEILTEYNLSSTGLVAYWPFDGNINDVSGNLNNGINYGGTFEYDRYAFYQRSIYFDGSTSYTEGMNPGNNLPTGDMSRTFSCWVKSTEAASSRNIFHYGTAEVAPTNYHLFMQDGKYVGIGNGYGFGILISSNNIGDGTWHFITTVYEGSSTNIQHIYIDGKLDTSAVISSTPNTVLTNNWRMGQFMVGSTTFLGYIDELKVYDIGLTEQEIWDKYLATTTAPNLSFPGNNSTINTLTPAFDWDSLVTANYYEIRISTDLAFTSQVLDENSYTSSYQVSSGLLQPNTQYYWKIRTINDGGLGPWSEVFTFNVIITSVENEQQIPTEFALLQNYPNPFNPSTKIRFTIPNVIASGTKQSQLVTLKVYDVLGNEMTTLVNEEKPAGSYEVNFNTAGFSSGIYFYKLQTGSFIETKKMILMK